MYHEGELVLYGSTGVCRVVEIKEQIFPSTGEARLYYVLRPLYQDCVISTPVDCDKVFIRPIITKEEAIRVIDRMADAPAEAFHSRISRELSDHYEKLLRTHDCDTLVKMTASIYRKKQAMLSQKRKFGTVDERFLRRAEELLFGELAAALEIPRGEVQEYIAARIEGNAAAQAS